MLERASWSWIGNSSGCDSLSGLSDENILCIFDVLEWLRWWCWFKGLSLFGWHLLLTLCALLCGICVIQWFFCRNARWCTLWSFCDKIRSTYFITLWPRVQRFIRFDVTSMPASCHHYQCCNAPFISSILLALTFDESESESERASIMKDCSVICHQTYVLLFAPIIFIHQCKKHMYLPRSFWSQLQYFRR